MRLSSMLFNVILCESITKIDIDLSKLNDSIFDLADSMAYDEIKRQEDNRILGLTKQGVANKARAVLGNVPEIDAYVNSKEMISKHSLALHSLLLNFFQSHDNDDEKRNMAFNVSRMMSRVYDKAGQKSEYKIRKDMDEWASIIIDGTKKNADLLKKLISQAISRIDRWGNHKITINPMYDGGKYIEGPVEYFNVKIGKENAGFSVFIDGEKITSIDDVLEGGGRDFGRLSNFTIETP